MNRPSDIDETASRANDEKTPEERRRGNRGGLVTDGKDADVPAGDWRTRQWRLAACRSWTRSPTAPPTTPS